MKLKFISVAILLAVPLNTYAKKWDIFLKSNLKGTSSRSRVSGYNLEKKLNVKLDYKFSIKKAFASIGDENNWFLALDKPLLIIPISLVS